MSAPSLPELVANSPTPGAVAPLTTLSAAISSTTATTMTTVGAPPAGLQGAGQFRVVVDAEVMLANYTAGTWTLVRGAEGSTKATHLNGASVFHYLTAGALTALPNGVAAVNATGVVFIQNSRAAADANPAFSITGGGELSWGAGGASAVDIALARTAAGVLSLTNTGSVGAQTLIVGSLGATTTEASPLIVGVGDNGYVTITSSGAGYNAGDGVGVRFYDDRASPVWLASIRTQYNGAGAHNLVLSANGAATNTMSLNGADSSVSFAGALGWPVSSADVTLSRIGSGSLQLATGIAAATCFEVCQTSVSPSGNLVLAYALNVGDSTAFQAFMFANNAGNRFYIKGNGAIYANGALNSTSDARLKEHVRPLNGALEAVRALAPKVFQWNQHPFNGGRRGIEDYGLIAQEVEKVLPHLVSDDFYTHSEGHPDRETFKAMRLGDLMPFVVGAIQELADRLDKLEA